MKISARVQRNTLRNWRPVVTALLMLLTLCIATNSHAQSGTLLAPPDTQTEVEIQVVIIDLNFIDSSQQMFTANVAMVARWHDHRLANSVKEATFVPIDQIWNPGLQVLNQQRIMTTMARGAVVFPDGTVLQRQRVWGDFSQPLDLHDFPLDRQTFEVRLGAAGYGPEQIKFVAAKDRPSGIANHLSLSDWEIIGHELDFSSYQAFEGLKPMASVAFKFTADRLRGYYVMKILLPLLLIVGMSFLVYWIPLSQTSSRISVSVTSMLTLIAYRFMIGGLLPKVSYMTRLDNFVMLSTLLVFITLLVAALTGAWEHSKPAVASNINRTLRFAFPFALLSIACIAFGT